MDLYDLEEENVNTHLPTSPSADPLQLFPISLESRGYVLLAARLGTTVLRLDNANLGLGAD